MIKIFMLFTGGTISSAVSLGSISPSSHQVGTDSRIVNAFVSTYPEYEGKMSFECEYALNLLSENMTFSDWDKIVGILKGKALSRYDAVFIAHGSDTLAYFANMLSVVLGRISVPVFVISSDKVLGDKSANGLINMKTAADAALSKKYTGVFVPYQNPGSSAVLHKGYQITQSQILGSDFNSIPSKPIILKEYTGFTKKVIVLKSYVGADYGFVDLSSADCVLIELYHGGTSDYKCVKKLCERAAENGKTVYAASLKSGNDIYETTKKLRDTGVKFLYDLTLETAYAALSLGMEL